MSRFRPIGSGINLALRFNVPWLSASMRCGVVFYRGWALVLDLGLGLAHDGTWRDGTARHGTRLDREELAELEGEEMD